METDLPVCNLVVGELLLAAVQTGPLKDLFSLLLLASSILLIEFLPRWWWWQEQKKIKKKKSPIENGEFKKPGLSNDELRHKHLVVNNKDRWILPADRWIVMRISGDRKCY